MGEKIVIDVETQKEFAEVEGRKPELLKVSVACVYSYEKNRYDAYVEADLKNLAPRLESASLIIGFNNRKFDMPVLQPYFSFSVVNLPMLDMMDDVIKGLGHRVSLDSLVKATLGVGKSGSGLDALKWYKEGRMDLITKYCLHDVQLTKDLYDYGKKHGRMFTTSKFSSEKTQIPVFWPERKQELSSITKVISEAFTKRLQVEIEYLSQGVKDEQSSKCIRKVDVYHFKEPFFEGYCHLRNDIRQFRIDRVLDIKPTWNRYSVPQDFVPTAVAE